MRSNTCLTVKQNELGSPKKTASNLPIYRICKGVFYGRNKSIEVVLEDVIHVGRVEKLEHPVLCIPFCSIRWVFVVPLGRGINV